MAVAGLGENIELQEQDGNHGIYMTMRPIVQQKDPQQMLQSVKRKYRCVVVSLGLVLVLLNIGVPLYLHHSNMVERAQLQASFDQLMTSYNNLTEEMDCRKLCEPHGFTFGDGLCYYVSTEKKNWTESRRWCSDRQSDLIVINSKKEQEFVASFNTRVWLGLSDRDREGSFQWVDGTPLTSPTFWGPRQPNNADDQHCVLFDDGASPSVPYKGWNDGYCDHNFQWICERVLC